MKPIRYPYRENKHRLEPNIYIGKIVVSFILCVKYRKKLFDNEETVLHFEKILIEELKTGNCSAYVYIFMPDHVHLLLSGNTEGSDIKKCLDRYKKKTGFWLYKNNSSFKWQKDYYDHTLRKDEHLETVIKYILNNPVRANFVEYWKQYKYKGSTVYCLDEWE